MTKLTVADLNKTYTWTDKGEWLVGALKNGASPYTLQEIGYALVADGLVSITGDAQSVQIRKGKATAALIEAGLEVQPSRSIFAKFFRRGGNSAAVGQ